MYEPRFANCRSSVIGRKPVSIVPVSNESAIIAMKKLEKCAVATVIDVGVSATRGIPSSFPFSSTKKPIAK